MNNLSALRERVEKADPADEIAIEILTEDVLRAVDPATVERCKRHFEGFGGGLYYPQILASIDAAVGLIERKLPDFIARESGFDRRESSDLRGYACITTKVQNYSGFAHSEPLALIAALLNALENGAPDSNREDQDCVR